MDLTNTKPTPPGILKCYWHPDYNSPKPFVEAKTDNPKATDRQISKSPRMDKYGENETDLPEKQALTTFQKHHILFFSPTLNKLVIPFILIITVSLFDPQLSNGLNAASVASAESVCNTRTKVWYPILNEQLNGPSDVF